MGEYKSLRESKVNGEAAAPVAAGMKRKASSCGEDFVPRRRNFAESTAASSNPDEPNASCYPSKGSSVEVDNGASKSVDPEVKEKEKTDDVETSTYKLEAYGKRNETTPLPDKVPVEQAAETPEMKSTPPPKPTPPPPQEISRRELTNGNDFDSNKPPTKSEVEDFFAEAERQHVQYFTKKYNFDFLNEKPLDGRYEWMPVEP